MTLNMHRIGYDEGKLVGIRYGVVFIGFLGLEEESDYTDWNFRSFWNGKRKELCYFEGGLNYVILQLFILLTVFLQGQNESPILC